MREHMLRRGCLCCSPGLAKGTHAGGPSPASHWRGSDGLVRDSIGHSAGPFSRHFKEMSNAVHCNAYKFKAKYVLNIVFN